MWMNVYACPCIHSDDRGRLSAEGADLALAAAPLATGVGQTHHHIPAFAISFAQGFQDLLSDERAGRPSKHSFLVVSGCEAYVSVSLEKALHQT